MLDVDWGIGNFVETASRTTDPTLSCQIHQYERIDSMVMELRTPHDSVLPDQTLGKIGLGQAPRDSLRLSTSFLHLLFAKHFILSCDDRKRIKTPRTVGPDRRMPCCRYATSSLAPKPQNMARVPSRMIGSGIFGLSTNRRQLTVRLTQSTGYRSCRPCRLSQLWAEWINRRV